MNLSLSYTWWFVPGCILLGVGLALLLYFYRKPEQVIPRNARIILGVVRALCISALAFLLLNPLANRLVTEEEPPVIYLLHDNSVSVRLNKDSVFYKGQYLEQWSKLQEELRKKYAIEVLNFGSTVSKAAIPDYSETETNAEKALKELETITAGVNTGAVIFASDGINTKGNSPITRLDAIKAPFYTIALGDTTTPRDWYIREVLTNKIAFTKSKFPVDIQIGADKLKGKQGKLTVEFGGKKLHEQMLTPAADREDFAVSLYAEAGAPGIQTIKVTLSIMDGETNVRNNVSSVFIEITDTRKKIALVSEGPHPDLGAIRQALSADENLEVVYIPATEFVPSPDYNLVILHSIPGTGFQGSDLLQKMQNLRIPVWFILGARTNLFAFNNLNTGVRINGNNGRMDDARLGLNRSFSAYNIGEDLAALLAKAPPLQTFAGNYEVRNNADVFATKNIGTLSTGMPAFVFLNENGRRTAVLTGEGLWRTRLYDFEQNQSQRIFDEWIQKTAQFLAIQDDRSKFRVDAKNMYNESEPVYIRAELYNDALEPVTDSEIKLVLTDSAKKSVNFIFSKASDYYNLNLGKLAPGVYSYMASTTRDGKSYSKSGRFAVNADRMEYTRLRADHDVLYQMAARSKGEMFYPQTMDRIPAQIEARDDIKTVTRSYRDFTEWIHWKWIFFVLLLLLACEWFARKWFGTY